MLATALAAILLAGCSKSEQAAAPAKTYTINLSPAYKVGQKFTVVSTVSEANHSHIVLYMKGVDTPQNDYEDKKFSGQLEADGEVLGVFPNGGLQKISLTVKSITAMRNEAALAGLPKAGAKIVAAREGDKVAISVDDQAAEATVTTVINELVPLDDDKFALQDLFGAKHSVPVGGTWPVNGADIADSLIARGIATKATGAKGSMKLDSIKGDGDSQVTVISGNFSVDSLTLPLPDTITVDSGSLTATVSCTIPDSTAKDALKISKKLTTKTLGHGDVSGASMKLDITGEQTRDITLTPQ